MRRILFAVIILLFATQAVAIENDEKTRLAVGFAVGASSSMLGHTVVNAKPFNQYLGSLYVASPVYVGLELSDGDFSGLDLAYTYASHTVGFWVMQPVNSFLFGPSKYKKQYLSTDGTVVMYTRRW